MAETTDTATTGFSWTDLGKSVISKGLDLADSYAAIAVAKGQTQTQVKAAEVAAASAPQNLGTKANAAPATLSTGAKIGIGAGVAAVLGLLIWAVFPRRK